MIDSLKPIQEKKSKRETEIDAINRKRGQALVRDELAILLGMSKRGLSDWLNNCHYDEIVKLGYRKHKQYIPPKVIEHFIPEWKFKYNE